MDLVFVYTAKNSLLSTLNGMAHKLFSRSGRRCDLRHFSQGYFHGRDEWMHFLQGLNADMEFVHYDEYSDQYGFQKDKFDDFPAIFVKESGCLKLWMDRKMISEMSSTDELMETIRAAVLRKQAGIEKGDSFLSMPA